MDTVPELMATRDSPLVEMERMGLKVQERDGEVERGLTRNLSALKVDAVKAIPEQNICKSASLGEQYTVSTFVANCS
jgi:hypothetical protein